MSASCVSTVSPPHLHEGPSEASAGELLAGCHTCLLYTSHREQQEAERFNAYRWDETGYVFVNTIGRPVEPGQFNARVFDKACAKAGIGHWRPHETRHSFISLGIEAGISIDVVSAMARHANIRTTLDVYNHVRPEAKSQGAAVMARVLGL